MLVLRRRNVMAGSQHQQRERVARRTNSCEFFAAVPLPLQNRRLAATLDLSIRELSIRETMNPRRPEGGL
ncbi:MAG TPA: hypothetical protein VKA46_35910 [Gemmataceae bacterium]|nr:hypothetical protein [Gemmataceae bacterium]